jgi:hypothetical protein
MLLQLLQRLQLFFFFGLRVLVHSQIISIIIRHPRVVVVL